jgi:deoxyguanosine kinase
MYIAIEGVIGVGKTSLVRLLQPAFDAEVLLEVFEANPFLSDFYADRARYALQTELFFLLSRYHQQRDVPALLERGAVIADFTFAKSALFASRNLKGDELELYRRLHGALSEKVPAPDLLVYLRAPTDVLMARIARRARPYELNMERAYIEDLGRADDEFLATYTAAPALIIDVEPLDFVSNSADLQFVAERIRAALGLKGYQAPLPQFLPESESLAASPGASERGEVEAAKAFSAGRETNT